MGEAGLGGWVGVSNAVFSTASVLCRIPRYSRGRHFVHLTLPVFNFGEKRKKKKKNGSICICLCDSLVLLTFSDLNPLPCCKKVTSIQHLFTHKHL